MEIGQSPQDEKADKKEEALPKTGESDHHAGRNIAATLLLTMGTVLTITKRNTKEVK
ncbi:MAG TPA: LPXTG cell wall anchor domain-containing protein [Staphylococcus auricularis]|nr:LPXTG cell wall anchor domain-containing protein [Staphylococcus auricularis]